MINEFIIFRFAHRRVQPSEGFLITREIVLLFCLFPVRKFPELSAE